MSGLDLLLTALPPWTLVGGKGGVGKTTCSAALALRSASRGARTLLLSTDPAQTLGDAIGIALTSTPAPVPNRPALSAMQLDAVAARDAFLARWRDTLITILDRGTYLDDEDITGLIDAAMPGADEAMALLTLAELADRGSWARIVIDTAPTGHTLRLLGLPQTFAALVELLDTMQAKHRFMVSALMHRYREDAADAFIGEMRGQVGRLREILADGERSAMVLVTRPEVVVAAETVRYAGALNALGIRVGPLVVNALPTEPTDESSEALGMLEALGDVARFEVPTLSVAPMGVQQIEEWGRSIRPTRTAAGAVAMRRTTHAGAHERHDAIAPGPARSDRAALTIRALTIIGGKGGVGKTTAACALALEAARNARVLLVSTDPAPSIADALDQPVGDTEISVVGAERLIARQMDAAAAFERLRADYQTRVDALFDGLVSRGLDATHDRAVIRDLMALAPPGIDELYALASLGETLAESRFDIVVVDPAPTGHLLRLLEMPALALDWTHRLLRMMLKYREVVGLGETAEELLLFAKRTRGVRDLLADGRRAGLFIVTLDEPLVRGETSRLLGAIAARGVAVIGLLWNRVTGTPTPLSMPATIPQLVGAAVAPPPRGIDALNRWRDGWTLLSPTSDG